MFNSYQVLGTVKDAALITVGVVFLHEAVSPIQLSGYLLSLVGFVSYNMIKAGTGTGAAGSGGAGGHRSLAGSAAVDDDDDHLPLLRTKERRR